MRSKICCLAILLVVSAQVIVLNFCILTKSANLTQEWRRITFTIPVLLPAVQRKMKEEGQSTWTGNGTVLPSQAADTQGNGGTVKALETAQFGSEAIGTILHSKVYTKVQGVTQAGAEPVELHNLSSTQQPVRETAKPSTSHIVVISRINTRVAPTLNQEGQPVAAGPARQTFVKHIIETETPFTSQMPEHHLEVGGVCREPYCLEYLTRGERQAYRDCGRRVTWKSYLKCGCRFMNGTGRKKVALVSLPGSGNTWVRGLLQKVTGICTGSIACDKTLRAEGFCGDGIHSSGQLVVKTHDSTLQWTGGKVVRANRPIYDAAIFVIRDPYKAAVAEWNRELSNRYSTEQTGSNHIKYMDNPTFFRTNRKWDLFTRKHINRWKVMMNSNVIKRNNHPILNVWYEDIKVDAAKEVKKILRFLEFPGTGEEKVLQEEFKTFYRNHSSSFDQFTASQKQYYNAVIHQVAQASHKISKEVAEKIKEYLRI